MQTARERTDSYAENGGHIMRQFHFSCIQSGNPAVLRSELQSAMYREGILRLFGDDVQAARISMSFVCAQAWYAAVQAGLSEKAADAFFDSYSRKVRSASSVAQMLDAQIVLLVDCAEAVAAHTCPKAASVPVQKCIDYIRAHICQPLTVQQVASALGFSESYLSRAFKSETQLTMLSYIQEEKIRTAKLLLKNPAYSVQDVMERLGYVSQSHFTKLFHAQIGMTPSRYRASLHVQRGLRTPQVLDSHTLQGRTEDYQRLVEYGREKGLEQQQYALACVRRGQVHALEKELQSAEYYAEICALFSGKLDLAIESMLTFWPQVMHAACASGVPDALAAKNLSCYTAQLYGCMGVSEVLDLNRRYLTEQAQAVSAQ